MSRYRAGWPIVDFRLETIRPGYTRQALLRCSGRLVLGRGAERHIWAAFLDGTERVDVLLDLAAVTDMDAAGIGVIAALCQSTRRRGGTVRLIAASSRVRTLFRVTGVEYALDANWSVKLEYDHIDLGTTRLALLSPAGLAFVFDQDQQVHLLKVGLNYRFAGGRP